MAAAKRYECLVTVETEFLPDQSDLERNRYAFAYHIKIVNTGNVAAQLISRHWVIDEFNGEQQEVRGLGVVGAQPLLQPGQLFEYTSGTVLTTPNGKMHGSYQMVADDGTAFDITVPAFTLSMPRVLH
ncbi:MAG: Co2+/Mg2+ efflux protein ApaG [Candidatus Methylopumilus sp.]|nr:Co2+/Mg2+ efflux protein ApaG [Candidatus Methylopumilus sp.]